jgi:hypothetical protein
VSDTINANANARAWNAELQMQALGSAASQGWSGHFEMSSATAPTTGTGPLLGPSNAALGGPFIPNAGTVDFSTDVGIVFTVQHSAASGSLTMNLGYVRIEVSG